MILLLKSLFFALPIFAGNIAPVLVKRVRFLSAPIDGGRFFRGQRILGDHKTWRGLISGVLLGAFTGLIQAVLFARFEVIREISVVEYHLSFAVILGAIMGFGALAGDAVKSFFKRRAGLPSGSSWPLYDQLDFIIGGLLFAALLVNPGLDVILILFFVTPFLHLFTNMLSYAIGLKEVPW